MAKPQIKQFRNDEHKEDTRAFVARAFIIGGSERSVTLFLPPTTEPHLKVPRIII